MRKKIIIIVLFACICLRVGLLIFQHKDSYAPDYWTRFETLRNVYGESQYSMKEWKYWIPDETVYAYAGGAYLKGANPIIVEPTQPPLGKYLISLSILITQNENILGAVFFVFLLGGIYILTHMMTGNAILSLVTAGIASFERLFVDQLAYTPLLDIYFIVFVLFAVITCSHALKNSKPLFIVFSYIFLSLSLMTKVWLIGSVFAVVLTLYILLKKVSYYPYILGGFSVILVVTLFSYTRMFADGYTLLEVLKVQKWLYWYYGGKLNHFFTVWPLVFLNRWYVWWGEVPVIKDASWSVSWPIVIGGGLGGSIYATWTIFKKTSPAVQLAALTILAYGVFISLGQASARYLLPFLPMCYSMVMWIVYKVGKRQFVGRKRR